MSVSDRNMEDKIIYAMSHCPELTETDLMLSRVNSRHTSAVIYYMSHFCRDYFISYLLFFHISVYFFQKITLMGTIDCGLSMVAQLFQGSFKKQLKFMQFVSKLKEPVITLTLGNVSPEEWQQSTSAIPR